jgi:hypothetical protein
MKSITLTDKRDVYFSEVPSARKYKMELSLHYPARRRAPEICAMRLNLILQMLEHVNFK